MHSAPILRATILLAAAAAAFLLFPRAAFSTAPHRGARLGNAHYAALEAELEARSAALAGSTDKADIKKKAALDKVRKSLAAPPVSIVKDLTIGGSAAKALAKLYPEEFVVNPATDGSDAFGVPPANLAELLSAAFAAFGGDLTALVEAAQSALDGALYGSCKDKAQAILDLALQQLAEASAAPTPAAAAAALLKAAKTVLKGESAVAKAYTCVPKLPWNVSVASVTLNGVPYSFYDDANVMADDQLSATYYPDSKQFSVLLLKSDGVTALSLEIFHGAKTVGPILLAGIVNVNGGAYQITSGSGHVKKFPKLPGHVLVTFEFTATGVGTTSGTLTATKGALVVYTYPL